MKVLEYNDIEKAQETVIHMRIAKLVHGQIVQEADKDYITKKRVLETFKGIINDAVSWDMVERDPHGIVLW